MDEQQLRGAFDEVFDQAVVFHGYAPHMRDYDVYIYATADPRTGIRPEHLRYRFTHCVRASASTAVQPDVWRDSLGDEFTDYERWIAAGEPDGYVWGVNWQNLYPGMRLLPESEEAKAWSAQLGRDFHEVRIETNGHDITLIFADLVVSVAHPGDAAFVVPPDGPDFKVPLP